MPREPNPWLPEIPDNKRDIDSLIGEGYSPDRVYRWARDAKGFTDDLRFKMPSGWNYLVQTAITRGFLPHPSPQDFSRDASYHRMKYWSDRSFPPELQEQLDIIEQRVHLEALHQRIIEKQALIESAHNLVSTARTIDERLEVKRYLEDTISKVKDEYYLLTLNQLLMQVKLQLGEV